MAGRVEAVGDKVTRFEPGDDVYAEVGNGAFADYVAVSEELTRAKAANATFEQAAAVPMAGMTALVGVRDKGAVQPGQSVLINGASGGVGTFAVQIAKSIRCRGDRSVQHARTSNWCGQSARTMSSTTPGRTSPRVPALRPDSRHRREPLDEGVPAEC